MFWLDIYYLGLFLMIHDNIIAPETETLRMIDKTGLEYSPKIRR